MRKEGEITKINSKIEHHRAMIKSYEVLDNNDDLILYHRRMLKYLITRRNLIEKYQGE